MHLLPHICVPSLQDKGLPGWLQPSDAIRDAHRSKWIPGDWTDDTDQLVCVLRQEVEDWTR